MYIFINADVYTSKYIYTCTYVYVYICIHSSAYVYIYTHIHLFFGVFACMYACVHAWVCLWVNVDVHLQPAWCIPSVCVFGFVSCVSTSTHAICTCKYSYVCIYVHIFTMINTCSLCLGFCLLDFWRGGTLCFGFRLCNGNLHPKKKGQNFNHTNRMVTICSPPRWSGRFLQKVLPKQSSLATPTHYTHCMSLPYSILHTYTNIHRFRRFDSI